MAAQDPGVFAHLEWLGYVQPVGLVVSVPAMLEAQCYVNKNIMGQHARFLSCLPRDKSDEVIPEIRDLPEFTRKVLGWEDTDLVTIPRGVPMSAEHTDLEIVLPQYNETLRPTHVVPEFQPPKSTGKETTKNDKGQVANDKYLLLIQELPTGTDLDEVGEADSSRHWHAAPQAKFERLLRETAVPIGLARENTVKVIKAVKADVACVVEVENRPLLHSFNRGLLGTRKFDFSMVIDGNDPRGIDVGLLSKFPIHGIWSHIFDGTAQSRTFSRDCLEVEVELPSGQMMYILCNHLKSRGYGTQTANDARRERQAEALRDILGNYNLASDWVVVAGDMNDSPSRPPKVLRHFLDLPNLFDVLELQFPGNADARWTYHYNGFEQIDYILVSRPLKQKFVAAGVERRGIHKLKSLTQNAGGGIPVETEYPTVTHWTNAASDHGAVWAEFNL